MRAYERLLKYAQYDTASDENSPSCPSTEKQKILSLDLVKEMREMGIQDAHMDEFGYVYGTVPANAEGFPAIGLIAHVDTVDCVPVVPMNARIVENYDGGDVLLDCGDILSPRDFPDLLQRAGKDLIVTDGRTLLGADDKAGIAEILTAVEMLLADEKPHGKIRIAFTPDEEIGRGADQFDVEGFGADYAYTVDGNAVGGLEYENFNAASANIKFHGRSVHPGSAKNRMINAALLAMEFDSMLPPAERPEHTEGYEGFYHLSSMKGECEEAETSYIIRDHDMAKFEARKATMERIAAFMNAKYGEGRVELKITDSYFNMRTIVEKHMHIVERAEKAYRAVGVEPVIIPIRGGTDGSNLSFKGLPCPNIATGAMNLHGRFECIAVQDMDKMAEMILALITLTE